MFDERFQKQDLNIGCIDRLLKHHKTRVHHHQGYPTLLAGTTLGYVTEEEVKKPTAIQGNIVHPNQFNSRILSQHHLHLVTAPMIVGYQ